MWEYGSKDNVKYFKLDEDKKQQIHFRDYVAIIKHNKPIRMLVIAAASNEFAQMVYGNSTVLVMLYGILMQNYPLAGIIGIICWYCQLGNNISWDRACQAMRTEEDISKVDISCNYFSDDTYVYDDIFADLTNVSLRYINFITVAFLLVFTLLNGVKSISNNIDCSYDCRLY